MRRRSIALAVAKKKAAKKGSVKKPTPAKLVGKAKPVGKAKRVAKTTPRKPLAKKQTPPHGADPLDLSQLPPESVTREDRHVCLACVLDVMTRYLGLAIKKAQLEVKRYAPTLEELRSREVSRPFFVRQYGDAACPYCGSAAKWQARLTIYRIENTKSADAKRRSLLKSLPEASFAVIEEKATQQDAFFQWAEKISVDLDLDDPHWLPEVSRHYLTRIEPKADWATEFKQIHSIRRSRRLESGWEFDHGRLFLAPMLFDELLLVQYLVSRAHRAGGLTLEGRYTLPELYARLRNSGYLRTAGVEAHNPSDAFEQLLTHLGGGDTSLRFYYLVDRRDLLERVKALEDVRVPKAKPQAVQRG
jgi:hypothetical protein